jgi:hypothetical protein
VKIDVVEQGYHVLASGGVFLTLSEYEKDSTFAKLQKKIFGKCGGGVFGSGRWGERQHQRSPNAFTGFHLRLPNSITDVMETISSAPSL